MAFGKIQRSAELFKQAWGVLRGDPQLAIFPVISAASTLLVIASFVTIFFNAALLGAADRKFRGLPTGVVEGLHVAIGRLPQILGWAIVSAIVGTILRMIEERSG